MLGPFDDAWAEGVTPTQWPEQLFLAIPIDPGALGTHRAIETLRDWREAVRSGDAESARRGQEGLRRVAEALVSATSRDREVLRPLEPRPEGPTETEPPTRKFSWVPPRAGASNAGTQVIRDASIIEARDEPEPNPPRFDDEPKTAALVRPPSRLAAPSEDSAEEVGEQPTQSTEFRMKPPAAEAQVSALATILWPLIDEIVPLPHPRRARRFWARWREVAGDHGVRRDFVEGLLVRAKDGAELLAELIAEVQGVDPSSVHQHLTRIGRPSEIPFQPLEPERERGPLVGASVRVAGASPSPPKHPIGSSAGAPEDGER